MRNPRDEGAIRLDPPQVHPGDEGARTLRRRERLAGIEQPGEGRFRGRTRSNRPELDVARAAAGLSARTAVTDG